MNYLAHIYLSKDDEEIMLGNFIADSVRGKDLSRFKKRVGQGIMLHRYIDTYTDQHKTVKASKNLIRDKYGLWSGVIVDMYYDHFLARKWNEFHNATLQSYVQEFYKLLEINFDSLPVKVQRFYPIMVEHDWLSNYASIEGISTIMSQMNRRTRGKSQMDKAHIDLLENYEALEVQFDDFMKDLINYVNEIYPIKNA